MKILQNKGICIILMLVLIAGGFLFGGYKGLAGQYKKVSDVFFNGEDRDGICVANDMGKRADALTNLGTVAKKYLSAGDGASNNALNSALADAVAAINTYTKAEGDIRKLFAANTGMNTAMENLYRELGEQRLSEKDEAYRRKLYAGFNSANDTISHDPYYSYAADYNEILMHFPANLIAALTPARTAAITR